MKRYECVILLISLAACGGQFAALPRAAFSAVSSTP